MGNTSKPSLWDAEFAELFALYEAEPPKKSFLNGCRVRRPFVASSCVRSWPEALGLRRKPGALLSRMWRSLCAAIGRAIRSARID